MLHVSSLRKYCFFFKSMSKVKQFFPASIDNLMTLMSIMLNNSPVLHQTKCPLQLSSEPEVQKVSMSAPGRSEKQKQ